MKTGKLLEILNRGYLDELHMSGGEENCSSKLAYVGDTVFEFVTYAEYYSEFLAKKAVGVWDSISERKTFDYIEDEEDHQWFLIICNMPFFIKKLNWGTSIRGAWWDLGDYKMLPSAFWDEVPEGTFSNEENWENLRKAIHQFLEP